MDFVAPNFAAGTVGAIVAPGGTGKSLFAMQLAMQIAGACDWLGLGDLKHGSVAYLAAEDPVEVLHQRLYAMGRRLTQKERKIIAENMLCVPLLGSCPNLCNKKWADDLKKAADGRRLMVLDTLRRFHQAEENSSGEMANVISQMESIAHSTGCSLLFVHHANKVSAASTEGDTQQASRGSSVLVDNIRWQGFLANMTQKEGDYLSVNEDERKFYVRFGLSKSNYGKPFSDLWLKREEEGILKHVDLDPRPTPIKRHPMRGEFANVEW